MVRSKQKKEMIPADSPRVKKQICSMCGQYRTYYSSKSMMNTHWGTLPVCKNCMSDYYVDANRRLESNEKALVELCKLLNVPFIKETYEIAKTKVEEKGMEMCYAYFSSVNHFKFDKRTTFMDSDMFFYSPDGTVVMRSLGEVSLLKPICETPDVAFDKTAYEEKWGYGYTEEEYKAMDKKYNFLKNNYPGKTSLHIEALTTYVRYKVKEEIATAKGDAKEAKLWGALASASADDAKINPSQLSNRDLQGGAGSFSEISEIVEQAVDIIPILPQFKNQPRDAADFIIYQYINYARDLEGLPLCEYKDVYGFYDKRVDEYIKQYGDEHGMFTSDPTKANREKIKSFISVQDEKEIENKMDLFESGDDDA